MLDALAEHLTRRRAGNVTRAASRSEAARVAIAEAHERAADQMAADHAAWRALVRLAGERAGRRLGRTPDEPEWPALVQANGTAAMLTLEAKGEPLEVAARLDGEPADLPLIIEDEPGSDTLVSAYLTDQTGRARLYLGTVSRRDVEAGRPALADRRLYSLADELSLPTTTSPEEK